MGFRDTERSRDASAQRHEEAVAEQLADERRREEEERAHRQKQRVKIYGTVAFVVLLAAVVAALDNGLIDAPWFLAFTLMAVGASFAWLAFLDWVEKH